MGRAAVVTLLLLCGVARAEPSNERLVLTGLAMAPPTYLLGVTLHEGSHALAAKLVGGTVTSMHLFPPGIDPKVNKFRFGWVYATGIKGRGNKIFFYLAPKITDALFLSTYAALYLTDSLPNNKYAQLALVVGATGFWVDFAKDVLLFSRHNDVVKAFNLWCMRGWKQIAPRVLYAGLNVAFGYAIAKGYQKLFTTTEGDQASMLTLPLVSSSF